MSRISVYMAGCALAVTLAFSTSASAQLLGGLGDLGDLGGVTEPLAPVLEAVAPVVETVLGPEAPLNEIVSVSENNGDYSVTVLQGDDPLNLPTGGLPVDVPGITVNLPDNVADIVPELPVIPDVPALPDFPDIINDNNNPGGGDGDIINNYPPGDPGTVIIIGDNDPDNPGLPDDPTNPGVIVINNPGTPGTPGTITTTTGRTVILSSNTGRNGSANQSVTGRSKLQMLIAMMQNRGWMRFVAGNGVCLPPYAVASVTDMLNRREERQFNGVVATFANDIATMRQMMANCRKGPRLQAQDINRVIGVGIGQNGAPILYVL